MDRLHSYEYRNLISSNSYFRTGKPRKRIKKALFLSYFAFLILFSGFITIPYFKSLENNNAVLALENAPVAIENQPKDSQGDVLGADTVNVNNLQNVVPNSRSAVIIQAETESNMAYALDKFLGSKKSPWTGLGGYIVSEANRIGVDPKLFVAIAGVESGWCRVIPINDDGTKTFNCLGWGKKGKYFKSFKDWKGGITGVMEGFRRGYGGGTIDPQRIKDTYCYSCRGNDNWSTGINNYIGQINQIYNSL